MKTTFKYDHYYLQDEIEAHIKQFAKDFPGIFDYEELITTPDGNHQIAVTLTSKPTGSATDKPAFYIDGNTHAGEVTGMMAAMHTMDYLVTNYGQDEKITFILDNFTIYIIPCISPDGSQTYLTTPYTLRSVNRPYYERGLGLGEEDIDGDGVIRIMRVRSSTGIWKKDPKDPDLMLAREPDEYSGEFYDLYTEGEIDDYNGVNVEYKKMKWGLDFNRNYPYGWFPEHRQHGAGPYPLSNPETKSAAEFIINHPNIGSVATNHTSGAMLLYIPGTYPSSKAPAQDLKLMKSIAHMGAKETGYKDINIFDIFTVDHDNYSSGAFDDYCYETQGIYAITLELWNLDDRCGVKPFYDIDPNNIDPMDTFAKRVNWVKENAPGDFLNWTHFNHPQLGDVEIGGFNYKFTIQNAPKHLLIEECEKVTKFMLRWAPCMPKLAIESVKATELENGYVQFEAVVTNIGYLPTYLSQKAKILGTDKPVLVSVDVPAKNLINCPVTANIGDLSSFGLHSGNDHLYGNIINNEGAPISKKVTWVFKKTSGSVTITVSNPKGGKVFKTINI